MGAERLIATPADDQERVTGAVGIDVHNVVGECLIETGRGRRGFLGDLHVQVLELFPDRYLARALVSTA